MLGPTQGDQEMFSSGVTGIDKMISFDASMLLATTIIPNGVEANTTDFIKVWYRNSNHGSYPNTFTAIYGSANIGNTIRIIMKYTKTA